MEVINGFVILKKLKEESSLFVHDKDKPNYFKGEVVSFDKNISYLKIGDVVLYDPVYIGFDMKYNGDYCVIIQKEYINARERN